LRGYLTLSFWILIIAIIVLPSCGDQTINFPPPTMKSISPTTAQQNSPQVTVTVTGNNFVQGTTVGVATTPTGAQVGLLTLFQDTNTLTATLTAAELATAQTLFFSVTTPQPGGGTFPPMNQTKITFPFIVAPAQSPVPHITSITPTSTLAATSNQVTVFVTGSGFVPQSIATLNQKNLTTLFGSPTALQAQVLATDLAAPGTFEIGVLNPQPGGGVSNQVPLSVLNPLPTLASVSPTSILAGGTPPTITLTGTGYVNQFTSINLNGTPFLSTIASSTSAFISLTAADLTLGGVDQIVAVNPQPGGGASAIATFAVNPTHLLGLPILVDLAADGSQANAGICGGVTNCQSGNLGLTTSTVAPSSSDTGEFVAFPSASHNLVLTDTNPSSDVYVRDTCLGVAACTPLTSVISLGPGGIAANGTSSQVTIDNAGTTAAFTSLATNLATSAPVPAGMTQVYWRPICVATSSTSCVGTTSTSSVPQLVSISADGQSAGNGPSYDPVISADGEFVAFVSLATNLVSNITAGDGTIPQVFIRDTCNISTATTTSSCVPTTFLVSTPDSSTAGNGPSSNPSISNSGLFVSFTSLASNLGATAPNPLGASEIFERSTCVTTISATTNTCVPSTTLVSTPDGSAPADGASDQSSISNCGASTAAAANCTITTTASNGRFVAFASTAQNLVAGAGPTQQIYVRDTCTGITIISTPCVPSTTLISTATGAPGNGPSEHPSISASGQFVAFASLASNLAKTTNGVENIFVRNTCLAVTITCTPGLAISSIANGTNASPSNGQNLVPSISADGHTVSFLSFSSSLVPRDTNGVEDIFLGSTTF
jgi:hypothetical protein